MKACIIFSVCILALSCTRPSIVGNWEVVTHPNPLQEKPDGVQWIISPDSTFVIRSADDSTELPSNIPGWHTSGTIRGKWSMPEKDQIAFEFLELPIRFKITKLDRSNLHLASVMMADSSGVIKLTRKH